MRALHNFQKQCQVHGARVAALHTAKENKASRFASSTEEEIERLLIDNDGKSTKRSTKVAKKLFHGYLSEKNQEQERVTSTLIILYMTNKNLIQ